MLVDRSRFFPRVHQTDVSVKLGDVRVIRGTRGGLHDLPDCLLADKLLIISAGCKSAGRAGCKYAIELSAFCSNKVGRTDDDVAEDAGLAA